MEWGNAAERARLIERVGAEEYNRLFAEHRRRSTLATVNGYGIRAVRTRFGVLFAIDHTDRAYPNLEKAKEYAASLPRGA